MGKRTPNIVAATGPLASVIGNQIIAGVPKTRLRQMTDFVSDVIGSALSGVAAELAAKFDDNVSAQNRVLGRISSGAGPVEEITPVQLTALLSLFQGDAGLGGVKGLVPAPAAGDAAAGKFLAADGTYAVPSVQGLTQISAGSLPTGAGFVDLLDIPSKYAFLLLQVKGVSSTSSSVGATFKVEGSVNNGTTFPTSIFLSDSQSVNDSYSVTFYAALFGYQGTGDMLMLSRDSGTNGSYVGHAVALTPITKSATINALRLSVSAGNFDAGTFGLYGLN